MVSIVLILTLAIVLAVPLGVWIYRVIEGKVFWIQKQED